jgi:hypothetical protein
MIGLDVARLELVYALQKIRIQFIKNDENIKYSFINGGFASSTEFKRWSSFKGIIKRSLTLTQHKTIVIFLNSLIFISLNYLLFANLLEYSSTLIGLLIFLFLLFIILHIYYASWRYKIAKGNIENGEFYWA